MTSDESRHSAPRGEAPPRPALTLGIPMNPEVPRPWIVALPLPLVLLSALAFIPSTVRAVGRQRSIRTGLEERLAERAPDYPASDIETTVLVTLIGAAALSVLLILAEIRSAQQVRHKVKGGRTWLFIFALFHLPLIAISPYLREGTRYDIISAAVQGACLALATVIVFLPPVTKWLSAVKKQGPIPLRPTIEGQS